MNGRNLAWVLGLGLVFGVASGEAAARPVDAGATAPVVKANGSRIGVRYTLQGTPAVGSPLRIVLAFSNVGGAGGAASLVAEPGLTLLSAPDRRVLPSGASTWTVEVQPQADGWAYLNVLTTQDGATSALSIPLKVGAATEKLPASPLLKEGAQGERLLIMRLK